MSGPLHEIAEFQLNVARDWLDRAKKVERKPTAEEKAAMEGEPAFEFVAYFSALNALYWLWGLVDGRKAFTKSDRDAVKRALGAGQVDPNLANRVVSLLGGMKNEGDLLDALVAKLSNEEAEEILKESKESVKYFVRERSPIRRMDKRSAEDSVGDDRAGAKHRDTLSDEACPSIQRLQALARILYLVRCNLVHGSKISHAEGDAKLLKQSVPPLKALALAATKYTEANHP